MMFDAAEHKYMFMISAFTNQKINNIIFACRYVMLFTVVEHKYMFMISAFANQKTNKIIFCRPVFDDDIQRYGAQVHVHDIRFSKPENQQNHILPNYGAQVHVHDNNSRK